MKTIESWIGKHVRIKDKYITDEWVNVPGLSAYFCGIERETFKVRADCYGVDLFVIRQSVEINELPSPEHQIIIQSINKNHNNYPHLWCAKYFEIVERQVTEIWVAK